MSRHALFGHFKFICFKRMNKHVDVVTVVRIWLICLWADVTSAERIPGVE